MTSNVTRASGMAWIVAVSTLALAATGHAQFAPSIPYNPYTYQYQSFSYPTIVNPALPNQARLNFRNVPDQGLLSLDPSNSPFMMQPLPRFDRALADERAGSAYGAAEAEYQKNVAEREQLYADWLRESDPEKRSQLANRLSELNDAIRNGTASRRRTGAETGAEAETPRPEVGAVPRSTRRTAGATPSATDVPRTTPSARRTRATAPATGFSTNNPTPQPRGRTGSTAPMNPARPDAVPNRVSPGTRGTAPATRPPAGAARTPDQVLDRSRNIGRPTTGPTDPGGSGFNPGGRRAESSSIGTSRFGTGQPSSTNRTRTPR